MTVMALMRGLHLAAMLSLLGTAGFLAWVLPVDAVAPRRVLGRLAGLSGTASVLAGCVWFVMQAAAIAGTQDAAALRDAFPVVALHTRYGNVMLLRLLLLMLATVMTRRLPWAGAVIAAAAAGMEGLIGHAGAASGGTGTELLLSEALHLIAAGLWLGALVPLWLTLGILPPKQAAIVSERFSPLGLGCVLVLAGTGFAQALELIGSLPRLVGTPYGRIALLKIGLFLLVLALAAYNRLWLTDRLADGASARRMRFSVAVETLLGAGVILAAASLASIQPAAHTEPVWPFPWQFSLVTLQEDDDFRMEVVTSLVLMGVATLALAAALAMRRWRMGALGLLLAIVIWRGPSLSLLLVEAYPTSFQTSSTGFTAASILRGQALFVPNCTQCHGSEGHGDGPAAASLRIKPVDLTEPHVLMHADGDMFWWLSHGIDDPEGGQAMPGFAAALTEDDRWAVIDYVRAHAVGQAVGHGGELPMPVRAPTFAVACSGLNATVTTDLRGHALVLAAGAGELELPAADAITVALSAGSPAPGGCAAADPAALDAYAELAGVAPGGLAGTVFLVDPSGYLRAVHSPRDPKGWHTAEELLAELRRICASPVIDPDGDEHEHHH